VLASAAGVPDGGDAATALLRLQVLRSLEPAATRNDPSALRLLHAAVGRQIEA
jgi:hypothetical protein